MSTEVTAPKHQVPALFSFWLWARLRDYGIVLAFVALLVSLSLSTDTFLRTRNLLNILDQSAPVGIIACAITICIIAGVFDLSTGSIFGVAAVVACKVAKDVDPVLGIGLGIFTGLVLGIVNGVLVHATRINSFIGTLATSIAFRGLAIITTGGMIVTVTNPTFGLLGRSNLLGAKYTVWVFGVFFVITGFLLARTTFGRAVNWPRACSHPRCGGRRDKHPGRRGRGLARSPGGSDAGHDRQWLRLAEHRHDLSDDRSGRVDLDRGRR